MISGFSYVDTDFYDQWKHLPFIMVTSGYVWLAKNKYVKRRICKNINYINDFPKYALHHLVKGFKSNDIYVVDHINGLSLDNRHRNLRVATIQQNNFNSKKVKKKCSSIYKGVFYDKSKDYVGKAGSQRKCWRAAVMYEGRHYSKWFLTELDAAKAYDDLAKKYFGEFANLNFPN